MHRIERNILHHAKQRKELRKYLKYSSEKQNIFDLIDEMVNEVEV